ncbi:MAG: cytochrome c [Methylophilaceae bacterium]
MAKNEHDSHVSEHAEPDEVENPLPWYITFVMGGVVMWGLFYISVAYMGADDYEGDNRSVVVENTAAPSAVPAIDGGQVFQTKCAACHQVNGAGVPSVFPPLAESEWVTGNAERLSAILLHGVVDTLTVKDVAYNGLMPPFAAVLSDAEIAAVLTHIRSQWGNSAEAIDEATVKKVREATKDKTEPWKGDAELAEFTLAP